MALVPGPDTASGRPEQRSDSGEFLRDETVSRSGSRASTTMGTETGSGLETLASAGMSDRPALTPGEQIGEFVIERHLGMGGMGQVFAARRVGSPKREEGLVALKYLERTGAATLYRFKQEFRALAGVTHENLVALGELVALPDHGTFFTMELIDGVPFDDYVRGRTPEGELPNLARLRRALKQLVAGVRHLHEHGCIHRDLKPTNVLVTAEGRVVILDFGLVQDHAGDGDDDPEQQIMGTPAYMSPEQAGLERAGPAADWYAVGVMLFECLSGQRPIRGSLTHLLFAKRECDPPNVAERVPHAPPELARLCHRLLARQPEDRPTGREIAALLEGTALEESGRAAQVRAPFIGRARELGELMDAFAQLREHGRPITVLVHGRSGYGKSALVRELVSRLRARERAIVFKGRCLERESVPYKGVDPVIDAMSVHLRQLSSETLAELVPAHLSALVRLFPVLDEVWSLDQLRALGRSLGRTSGLEAHELRQRAFASLRELLSKLAQRRPLVVTIDDFQWANVDSALLLNELLRPPDAPPLLLVISYRDGVAAWGMEETEGLRRPAARTRMNQPSEAVEVLKSAEAVAGRDVRELEIGPLAHDDARALALALMGDEHDPERAEAFAAQAEGSPFYVGQMVHGDAAAGASVSPGQLDQLVVRRILQLDAPSRALLEIVAVAGGPIDSEAAFAACEIEQPERVVPALLEAELLRSKVGAQGMSGMSGMNGMIGMILETAHDRIREVTVGELEPAQLRATHLRLAVALERHGSDPEALAQHFERGGDRATAAEYYQRAAEQAGNSLAFARSVALFQTTLELLGDDADPSRVAEIRRGLAEQLINSGRGHEAAQLLLALAEQLEQGELARARELRRQAADQLIKTGHVEEGLAELDRLLRSVGLQLPGSTFAAVSALLWEQARLRVRGFGFERRAASELPAELLDQIDTCFAVVNGLSTQETLLSALFHFRNLRLSLQAGEPYRVARALAYQCVIDVAGRDWRRVEQHFATARALASELEEPQLSGFIDLCDASVHWFERRYLQSSVRHVKVIDNLEGVAGAAWDRRTAQIHHMWTLLNQGRLREFWAGAKGTSERARERGDMQEMVEVSSYSAIALTLAGKVDEAKRVLAAAQAEWNPGRYLFGDVWACFARTDILLHTGEPEQAVALVEDTLTQMKRTFLDQSAMARHNAQEHLCRSLLVAALLRDDGGYARRARKLSAKLRAADNDVLTAQMAIVDAGLASMNGDREAALRSWSEAATRFEAHGVQGHVAAICARKAAVLPEGPEARSLAARAQDYFEREGIEDPDGFLRTLAPANMDRLLGK